MFELHQPYPPDGDQPGAIAQLSAGLENDLPHQVLLGVTGSGKTYTLANVISKIDRPTLVISHNKTLAAQLYAEFKGFFPNNAVEYFISYFDYYQPEAYIARTDTFIEKDSSVNEDIERMRLATMSSLLTRRDVLVVASVSCIYGIGNREDYESLIIPETISPLSGANFAFEATRWISAPPKPRMESAWNFSARKSTASSALTH